MHCSSTQRPTRGKAVKTVFDHKASITDRSGSGRDNRGGLFRPERHRAGLTSRLEMRALSRLASNTSRRLFCLISPACSSTCSNEPKALTNSAAVWDRCREPPAHCRCCRPKGPEHPPPCRDKPRIFSLNVFGGKKFVFHRIVKTQPRGESAASSPYHRKQRPLPSHRQAPFWHRWQSGHRPQNRPSPKVQPQRRHRVMNDRKLGIRSSGISRRVALYSGKMSLRKLRRLASNSTNV